MPLSTRKPAIIDQRLNKEWYGRVCDAVNEQIASDREDAADARADARRGTTE